MSQVSAQERVGRAVALGMAGGLLIGGLTLLGLSYRSLARPAPCDPLSGRDCELELQLASDFARYQSWFGLTLVLLGTALVLYVWAITRRERRAKEV